MRVLIEQPAPKHHGVLLGWLRAFEFLGSEVTVWERGSVPAMDAFDAASPHAYIGTSGLVPARCLKEHKRCRTIDASGANLRPGFDHITLQPSLPQAGLACDVAFWGTWRPDRAKLLLPLCSEYNVKIFGHGPWPMPQYLGPIAHHTIPAVVASARVCLHLGLDSERCYQIQGLAGVSCRYTDADMVPLLVGLLPMQRRSIGEGNRDFAVSNHTYFHRVADMLQGIGHDNDAKRLREAVSAAA